jgi:hypothetical protein
VTGHPTRLPQMVFLNPTASGGQYSHSWNQPGEPNSQCSTSELTHPQNVRLRHEPTWTPPTTTPGPPAKGNHRTGACVWPVLLLRKEVIQPHLPVRLPCYDFVPIAGPTFDGSPHKGWATGFGCCRLS